MYELKEKLDKVLDEFLANEPIDMNDMMIFLVKYLLNNCAALGWAEEEVDGLLDVMKDDYKQLRKSWDI
jgi:hypothetical protein